MGVGVSQPTTSFGFLTVVNDEQLGLFGGYLLLNQTGRPLEFHCTAPIKTNRAQEILYGPTLTPFLYGEQIGHALVAKSTCQPRLVCTDLEPVLALRDHTSLPVGLVLPAAESPAADERSWRVDAPHGGSSLVRFSFGRNRLAAVAATDESRILDSLRELHESFDLDEPFARIREAIAEAQRVGR